MIVYGTGAKRIDTFEIPDPCPNCGVEGEQTMVLFQRYFHIFWIPFIPISKTAVSHCEQCRRELELNDMPEYQRQTFQEIKATVRTPLVTYAGVGVVLVVMALGTFFQQQKQSRNSQMILELQANDLLEVKIDHDSYSLLKVHHVVGDTVYLLEHEYESNVPSGISELKKREEYHSEQIALLTADVKEMFDTGVIIDIDRD